MGQERLFLDVGGLAFCSGAGSVAQAPNFRGWEWSGRQGASIFSRGGKRRASVNKGQRASIVNRGPRGRRLLTGVGEGLS